MQHPELAGFPVIVEINVAWGEMDAFSHVNNVVYFRYFENARVEYVDRVGWFDTKTDKGIGPILASVSAKFIKPVTYPDRLWSAIRVNKIESDRVFMEHLLVSRELNAVVTVGESVSVCFDYGANKKTPIPDDLRKRIEDLERIASDSTK